MADKREGNKSENPERLEQEEQEHGEDTARVNLNFENKSNKNKNPERPEDELN